MKEGATGDGWELERMMTGDGRERGEKDTIKRHDRNKARYHTDKSK